MRYAHVFSVLFLLICTYPVCQGQAPRSPFSLSKIDGPIVKEFQKAWKFSGDGTLDVEGVVLIFLNADGSYRGVTLGPTNERKQVTFKWVPGIIAIVHTHPTHTVLEPIGNDISLADRFGVPIFTITRRGMFMYDPGSKQIQKIKDGLDWLDPSHWARQEVVATNKHMAKE